MHIDCRNDEKQVSFPFSSPLVRILRLQYFEYFMPAERAKETGMFDDCGAGSFHFSCFSCCHIAVDEYVDVQAADSNAIFLGARCVP